MKALPSAQTDASPNPLDNQSDPGRSVVHAKRHYAEANRCGIATRSLAMPHGSATAPLEPGARELNSRAFPARG